MTPERFEKIRKIINDRYFVCDEKGALAMELLDECEYLRSRLADLEARSRWIPVGERLPEKEGIYIIYDPWRYGVQSEWWYGKVDEMWKYVTHWRPLPEGPEEG